MKVSPYTYCKSCPLYRRKQFVPFESPEQTELAIIGESPGRTEVIDRRPFIGESGRLLNDILELLDVNRDQVFIGNVCLCRAIGQPDTKPTDKLKEICGYLVTNMMHKHGVKRVLTLGGVAMNYFRGTIREPITRTRGKPFTSRSFMTRDHNVFTFEVMPTFHPAAVLRRPDGLNDLHRDIELFFYPGREVRYQPGDYEIVDNVRHATNILRAWQSADLITIDLETSGYMPHKDYIICVSMSRWPGEAYTFTHEVIRDIEFWRWVKKLNDGGVKWAMHGAFFDHRWVFWKTRIDLNVGLDTMLSNYTLDERGGVHDLKHIAGERFAFPDWETVIQQYLRRRTIDSYAKIPRDVLYEYAAYDADACMRLARAHLDELTPEQIRLNQELLVPGTVTLGKMALSGIKIDTVHWLRLLDAYEAVSLQAREYMREWVRDDNFNPNSPKQVQHWMYDVFDLPTHDKSAKLGHHPKLSSGRTSTLPPRTTAMDQLERLAEGYPQSAWIRALITYRTKRKAVTSYLKGYTPSKQTGRIHPRYLVHGTRTGRLSSREPNIMNAPHYGYIRELIIPAEGCILVSVDYSQAELRVLAALSRSEAMAEIYRKGGDLHDIVATEIFGRGYTKRERMIAKAIVFGLVYGRSIANIAETFGITMEKANEYYYTFLARFDNVLDWMNNQKNLATSRGYVELPTGRRRRFPLITRSNIAEVQRQAVNTPVQGTASDLMFMSLIELYDLVTDSGGHLLFPLHDSIMFELPLDRWKEITLEIVNVMETVPQKLLGDFLPFAADCDVGWRWGRMFEFKKKNGILILDEDSPGWWPKDEVYVGGIMLADWEVVPENENWWTKLDWNLADWEDEAVNA